MTAIYVFIVVSALCVVLKAIFNVRAIQIIFSGAYFSAALSYVIFPVIPWDMNTEKLLSADFAEMTAASATNFILSILVIFALIMALSIFFDKATEFALDLFSALLTGCFVFICMTAIRSMGKIKTLSDSFLENFDTSVLKNISECFSFETSDAAVISILVLLIWLALLISLLIGKKIYEYMSLLCFSSAMGCIYALLTFICSLFPFKDKFSDIQLSNMSALKTLSDSLTESIVQAENLSASVMICFPILILISKGISDIIKNRKKIKKDLGGFAPNTPTSL